jgi:hypothetical protein
MMQKLKKIFTVFMVLTILVSSHSFAYYEHICLITKERTLSFEGQTCAGKFFPKQESKTPELKRSSCCELSFKIQKVDSPHQNHLLNPFFDYCVESFQNSNFVFSCYNFSDKKSAIFIAENSSPPKKKLFLLHDQFLI